MEGKQPASFLWHLEDGAGAKALAVHDPGGRTWGCGSVSEYEEQASFEDCRRNQKGIVWTHLSSETGLIKPWVRSWQCLLSFSHFSVIFVEKVRLQRFLPIWSYEGVCVSGIFQLQRNLKAITIDLEETKAWTVLYCLECVAKCSCSKILPHFAQCLRFLLFLSVASFEGNFEINRKAV